MDAKIQAQAVESLTRTIDAVKSGKCNNLILCYEDGESLHRHYAGNPVTITGILFSQATIISMDLNKHDVKE